jgi:hypothetical protein
VQQTEVGEELKASTIGAIRAALEAAGVEFTWRWGRARRKAAKIMFASRAQWLRPDQRSGKIARGPAAAFWKVIPRGDMSRQLWRLIAASTLVALVSAPAWAQWNTNVSGPDVFGNTKVVAVVADLSENGLVVQCDAKDERDLAFLSPATPSELDQVSQNPTGSPATLLIKVDQGKVWKFDAMLRGWNAKYIGFVAGGRSPDMLAVIRAIGAATQTINVGEEANGAQDSESFAASGSTSAMNTAIKDRNLAAIDSTSPAGGAPAQPSQ